MTVLGIKAARKTNGVSAMHGEVTRRMWKKLWPRRTEWEVPIGHITNGVHVSSWLAQPMYDLYSSYLGGGWEHRMCSPETWAPITSVDDDELWEAHQIIKARLVSYVQRQVSMQEAQRAGVAQKQDETTTRLDPAILTIGFCRRFATYKRAALVLGDEKRLERLVSDPERPVQFIFSGKAHPKDEPGKQLIRRIFEMCHDPRFLGRVAFIEDYDINVGRHLVQGVDLWLNTPRKPMEASGTSGMKAVFNGALNLSILDGWWAEAYDGSNGFAIGVGAQHARDQEQDRRDVEALYSALENQVIPLYYERDSYGIPSEWVARMKNAIRSLAWRFNADRMLMQYARECYLPLAGLTPNAWDERGLTPPR
jgi:starch phosphorylase